MDFIYSYLKKRSQRVNINAEYSSWKHILNGVPQCLVLGPLLFNIFINDIFYFIDKTNIANYADDNTIYAIEDNNLDLLQILNTEALTVFDWFKVNEMKPNSNKSRLIIANNSNNKYSSLSYVYIDNDLIESEETVKLLGVEFDERLNFNDHITTILKKEIKNCML